MRIVELWRPYIALGAILFIAAVMTAVFLLTLVLVDIDSVYIPSEQWIAGWYSIFVFVSWWIVYYRFSRVCPYDTADKCDELWRNEISNHPIITLRTFLEFNTARGRGGKQEEEELTWKSSNTINTVGTIVAISLLILSFTINTLLGELSTENGIELVNVFAALDDRFFMIISAVLIIQIAAVVQFLISVDSLDTSMNEFSHAQNSEKQRYQLTRGFYVRGIKRYYNGLILFVLSLFLLTMTVTPIVTVIGVGLFAYLGYDYWFGYVHYDT